MLVLTIQQVNRDSDRGGTNKFGSGVLICQFG